MDHSLQQVKFCIVQNVITITVYKAEFQLMLMNMQMVHVKLAKGKVNMLRKLVTSTALFFFASFFAVSAFAASSVKEGTDVELRFLTNVSSATATTGEKFELEVAQDVREGERIVIPAGSKAVGTVQNAKKKGMMGKSGELNVAINYVLVNGTRVPLRASQGAEGEGRTGSTVALTVLFGPVGLLKRGLDVTIPAGKTINAAVDSTTEIAD